MRKMIMILALTVPLLAQEAKDDPFHASVGKKDKKEVKDCCKVPKRSAGMERRKMAGKQQKMHKKQQIKNVVRLAVVGGLAYYIGYHQGEEHFNGGIMKRRPYFGDRK